MKSVSRQIISAVKGGNYATQAASHAKAGAKHFKPIPQEVKVTRLPNGVVVASLENYSPISRVSVLYNAGSRHESADNQGITHYIRAASNLSTQKSTRFLIAKQLQQIGANLTCSTAREHVSYTVECLRDDLAAAGSLLNSVATAPIFKTWEVDSLSRRLRLDLELLKNCPETQLIELLHKAAYRDSLGQSLYVHPDHIGSFSPQALEQFVQARHVSQGAAVAGVGVDHELLVLLARKMSFHQGGSNPPEVKKSKYHGGELRLHTRSPYVHAALVTEGVNASTPQDVLAISLLQLVLGVGPFIKYSSGSGSSKISKAAQGAVSGPVAASSINVSYSDSGLFGFRVISEAKEIRKALGAIVAVMGRATKGSIADADLQRAKAQLKSVIHIDNEDSAALLENIGTAALLSGKAAEVTASAIDSAVDKITAEDVSKIAKKVINGKPTLAVVGDLSNTPYLDELVNKA